MEIGNETYIAVIGGANVDIGGRPAEALIRRDSNPGRVHFTIGGVAHNIARNLRLLDLPVQFMTAIGNDENGTRILRDFDESGIGFDSVIRVQNASTSIYLYITDEKGDMALAVNDMEICKKINPAYLENHRDCLESAAAVVVDANIPEESIRWLADNCPAPLFADPVSVSKSSRLKASLGRFHTLKPNLAEAAALSGISPDGPDGVAKAARNLLSTGLKQVFISLGSKGVFAAREGEEIYIPCVPCEQVNTTGAGDAFMAGLVLGYTEGLSLKDTAKLASVSASFAVETPHSINQELTRSLLEERLRTFVI